jgi:hypothetical protein
MVSASRNCVPRPIHRNTLINPRVVLQRQWLERGFVMPQPGPTDYRTAHSTTIGQEHFEGAMDQVSESARDMGERAATMVGELGAAIKQRPYTTLAIAAGLAFAVGALWKLGHRQPQTRLEALRARVRDAGGRLSELPSWDGQLPRQWLGQWRGKATDLLPRQWR